VEEGQLTEDEQRRVDAFLRLTRLERGLRKALEIQLRKTDGLHWVGSLPKDVRQKIESRGLDFVDFPDLKKIIGSAWRKLDTGPAGLNKAQVLTHLEGLEQIRNDLAHSRSISKGSLSMVEAAYHVVSPLFNSDSPSRSLPPTPHLTIALGRMAAAIAHHARVSAADLHTLPEGHSVRESVETYERVRQRPGRAPSLLVAVHTKARDAVASALNAAEI
jgi:hypothetical protein